MFCGSCRLLPGQRQKLPPTSMSVWPLGKEPVLLSVVVRSTNAQKAIGPLFAVVPARKTRQTRFSPQWKATSSANPHNRSLQQARISSDHAAWQCFFRLFSLIPKTATQWVSFFCARRGEGVSHNTQCPIDRTTRQCLSVPVLWMLRRGGFAQPKATITEDDHCSS